MRLDGDGDRASLSRQGSTLAQRLVRAKHKIAEAGAPFELPAPDALPERMEAVLSTLEIAYSKVHEDAGGAGAHAGYAAEMLHLSRLLANLAPWSGEAFALAALIRYAEARRPARVDAEGAMIPLAHQAPEAWRRDLIAEADDLLAEAARLEPSAVRTLQAQLQQVWCARRTLDDPPPWRAVLALYDRLLQRRADPVVRLNRAVALAEVKGAAVALNEVESLASPETADFLPYHAVRADLLARVGDAEGARAAYARALSLGPNPAEARWLARRAARL